VIASGGTGGHVYPALAIADALRRRAGERELKLLLVGTRAGVERHLFQEVPWPTAFISARPLPRRLSARTVASAAAIALGFLQAWRLLRRFRPSLAIGTGGYASVCTIYTASLLGIKTLIHEMDAIPGRANRFLARRATAVTVGFPSAAPALRRADARHTGNPVRSEFANPDRAAARKHFALNPDLPTLLVFGGSQGALSINRAVLGAIVPLARDLRLQVVHVTGPDKHAEIADAHRALPDDVRRRYHPLPYLRGTVHLALAAADIVLSRAGAAFLAELTAVGRPAILVPYPYSMAAHQQANAEQLARAGAALVLDDAQLRPRKIVALLGELLADRQRLERMAQASRALGNIAAADHIAEIAWELMHRPP